MAARQIMNMTGAIVLQKLNIAQIALGAKKTAIDNFHDEYKSKFNRRHYEKGGFYSKHSITNNNALESSKYGC